MYVDKYGRQVVNEYDSEPVYFCRHCLSLDIRIMDDKYDYCNQCGGTAVDSTDIRHWDELYRLRYGKRLLAK